MMMDDFTKKLAINFFIGGSVVAGTSYLSTFTSPLLGAIFWSYPFTIIPTIFYIRQNNKSNVYNSKFLFSTSYALILLFICIFSASYFLKNTPDEEGVSGAIFKTTIVWIIMAFIFYICVMTGGYKKYFI